MTKILMQFIVILFLIISCNCVFILFGVITPYGLVIVILRFIFNFVILHIRLKNEMLSYP
jgi:hypothetical protein